MDIRNPIFLLCFLFVFSCNKKPEKPNTINQDSSGEFEMQKLTASPWIIYKLEASGTDATGVIPDCQLDDTYRFYRDSALVQYENNLVCSGNPDSTSTKWKFYDGRNKLIATVLNLTDTATILSLNENEMKLGVTYFTTPAIIYFKKP